MALPKIAGPEGLAVPRQTVRSDSERIGRLAMQPAMFPPAETSRLGRNTKRLLARATGNAWPLAGTTTEPTLRRGRGRRTAREQSNLSRRVARYLATRVHRSYAGGCLPSGACPGRCQMGNVGRNVYPWRVGVMKAMAILLCLLAAAARREPVDSRLIPLTRCIGTGDLGLRWMLSPGQPCRLAWSISAPTTLETRRRRAGEGTTTTSAPSRGSVISTRGRWRAS